MSFSRVLGVKMDKSISVNSFIGSLPKIPTLYRWTVFYNGNRCGTVRAKNKGVALGFISTEKYPERDKIVLEYIGRSL